MCPAVGHSAKGRALAATAPGDSAVADREEADADLAAVDPVVAAHREVVVHRGAEARPEVAAMEEAAVHRGMTVEETSHDCARFGERRGVSPPV